MRSEYAAEQASSLIRKQVVEIRAAVANQGAVFEDVVAANALLDEWLLPMCSVSAYIARTVMRYPQSLVQLLNSGSLVSAAKQLSTEQWRHTLRDELESALADGLRSEAGRAQDSKAIEALQQRVLRVFRHRHMLRILWRDLSGVAHLEDTLLELSLLADACVCAADEWTHQSLSLRYGQPLGETGEAQRLIVLGMGKLGGYELNVSSDIDLICLYAQGGQTTGNKSGARQIDNGEFFRRSVQGLTRLLNSVTEDGFAFRVDTRLRPFGESGPLVMNLEGLEQYYLTQARDWERYAMIKARAITGLPAHRELLEKLITPFVYRRYLDYNAFDSLRKLKHKIAVSVASKGMVDNIKLGAGGIREIEFIGQAFQLVRGGRDERLRIRSIIAVLHQLGIDGLMPQDEVNGLLNAYAYLRRVENAVQMMRDEQVHSLPQSATDKQQLLVMMDAPDWPTFRAQLDEHQQVVTRNFTALFAVEDDDPSVDKWTTLSATLGSTDIDEQTRVSVLHENGFEPNDELLSAIDSLGRGSFYQRLTAEGQDRVERIVPLLLKLASDTAQPSDTLLRCLSLVRAVAGRSGYLQVLSDQPAALSRLVTLFAQSSWLANFVLRQPIVIDELLTGSDSVVHVDATAVRRDAMAQLERLQHEELDVQMDSLRHFRQSREMRIACAQLDGTLTLMQVSDQLTWLAEALIETVLALVQVPLLARYGCPNCVVGGHAHATSVGIVAYGKLGGLELGFGSDLDLVFVHDSTGSQQLTDGDKPIDNSVFYARLAQKFVHFMSTLTPAGVLYEIDLRLRPNGSSGVLVTGMDAFAQYQSGQAWTWEHQALMRARMVFGSERLHERFSQIRTKVLGQSRSADELQQAVASMRERMRSTLGANQHNQLHLKQDAGGVADIEFIVQFLVLAHSAQYPALLTYTDNIRVLDTVEALGLLSSADTTQLRDSYLVLRERLHRQALQEASSVVPLDPTLTALRDAIIEIRTRILGES